MSVVEGNHHPPLFDMVGELTAAKEATVTCISDCKNSLYFFTVGYKHGTGCVETSEKKNLNQD